MLLLLNHPSQGKKLRSSENTASGRPTVCAICGGWLEVLRREAAVSGVGAPDLKSGAERKLSEKSLQDFSRI